MRLMRASSQFHDVDTVVASLKRLANKRTRDGLGRYGIPSDNALGVTIGAIQKLAKSIGRDHALAEALWQTGWYEARLLASFVDDAERVTPAQMDRWCRDFDNWGICDTVCFALFDRSPHAWRKVPKWAGRRSEFEKRGAFALLACLALHDKNATDDAFLPFLPLIERAATDNRNFVKKAVNWALRAVGGRSAALNAAAVAVSRRLARSPDATAKWVGKDALRQLTSPVTTRRLAAKARGPSRRKASPEAS
jgi:3-methyladenine DNA glycosylase AlkD